MYNWSVYRRKFVQKLRRGGQKPQDTLEVTYMSVSTFANFTDVTLVSEDADNFVVLF